jgi:hypothetical protein
MASWKLSRVPVLDDEQPAPGYLSDREIEELDHYKTFYHRGFTMEQIRQLRFRRWLVGNGRLADA